MDARSDPIEEIIEFIVDTRYDDLPAAVVDWTKKALLDTWGAAIAGFASDGIPQIVKLVREMGGKPESTIWVYGDRVPASEAAFANGPMARALELGDVHPRAGHLSEYVFPALIPAAEMKKTVTGKELITAYAVGAEVLARLGNSTLGLLGPLNLGRGMGPIAILGATAAVSKVLDFDKETTHRALGISLGASSDWTAEALVDSTLMVRTAHGFLCEDAIRSALLAQSGITGIRRVISGPRALFANFCPGENRLDLLTRGLGDEWQVLETMVKPYASCKLTHTPAYAVQSLMVENGIAFTDIQHIDLRVCQWAYTNCCQPETLKWNPQNMVECQFSVPYVTATCAVKGKVFLDDYAPQEISRADVKQLMMRITVSPDATFPKYRAKASIKLNNGKEFVGEKSFVKGDPRNPMTWEDMVSKFSSCVRASAHQLASSCIENVPQKIKRLEETGDVTQLVGLITP